MSLRPNAVESLPPATPHWYPEETSKLHLTHGPVRPLQLNVDPVLRRAPQPLPQALPRCLAISIDIYIGRRSVLKLNLGRNDVLFIPSPHDLGAFLFRLIENRAEFRLRLCRRPRRHAAPRVNDHYSHFFAFRAFDRDLRRSMPESTSGELLKNSDIVLALCAGVRRSEEHTSELQSLRHLVCRLLLE